VGDPVPGLSHIVPWSSAILTTRPAGSGRQRIVEEHNNPLAEELGGPGVVLRGTD